MTQTLRENTERIMPEKGYETQAKLAERIGVTEQHLNAVLNGRKSPGRKMLERMADVLGVTVPRLLTPAGSSNYTADGAPQSGPNRTGEIRVAKLLIEVNESLLLAEGKADDETALRLAINMLTNKLKALEAQADGGQGREKDAAV